MHAKAWRRDHGLFQLSVARLMALVAVVGVLCWAWLYRREHASVEAMESVGQLGDICQASPVTSGASVAASVVVPKAKQIAAALLLAMHDPAIEVRSQAVWSLAHVGPLAGTGPAAIKVAVENDPAIEVRAAATRALLLGWPEYSLNQDVLGR